MTPPSLLTTGRTRENLSNEVRAATVEKSHKNQLKYHERNRKTDTAGGAEMLSETEPSRIFSCGVIANKVEGGFENNS